MKQCQKCLQDKPLTEFKLVSPRKVPMRFCLSCYTENRKLSRSGEKPFDERNAHLERVYGITSEEYRDILNRQGGRCAICLGDDPKSPARVKHWYVDHCHSSGKVRGLLCNACNRALGNFGDSIENLERAILYLRDK